MPIWKASTVVVLTTARRARFLPARAPLRCLIRFPRQPVSFFGRVVLVGLLTLAVMSSSAGTARAQSSICQPDGVQASGSIYRICMPTSGYNGMLVVWAHGFQDAGTPVSIPEDQLCTPNFCLPELVNGLGFAFATNSYSKTGLAVLQGEADILDLVKIFAAQHAQPRKVYLVGASEGGIITTLSVEQHPNVFSAGLAACGPIGDFQYQLNYFGDARATFQYFFPTAIPGDPFNPSPGLVANWSTYYESTVKPIVFDPANRHLLDQWVRVAHLPFDSDNYLGTVGVSVRDVLRYSVVNLKDAATTLGGFPFDNALRWYSGSDNDLLLNLAVRRVSADPAAVAAMMSYNATGVLRRPLITLHTLRDQQVPYAHEQFYALKTLLSGSLFTRHLPIPIDRFGHCNFTRDEALFSFAVMLLYDGILDQIGGTASYLTAPQLAAFESRAKEAGLPYRRGGHDLTVKLKTALAARHRTPRTTRIQGWGTPPR
jgi:pimeloyl-ACP methyl ester carboxylesterase